MDLITHVAGVANTASFNPGVNTPAPWNVPHVGMTDGTSIASASNNMAEIYNRLMLQIAATIQASGIAIDNTNWAQLPEAISALAGGAVNPGLVSFYAGTSPPTGWLKANGALLSRTTYSRLFSAIGTTYGAGDGSTTFGLPDLRGEFLRGFDDGRGVDTGRVLGSAQTGSDLNGQLYGNNSMGRGNAWRSDEDVSSVGWENIGLATMTSPQWSGLADAGTGTASAVTRVTGKARPRNVALLACIKY